VIELDLGIDFLFSDAVDRSRSRLSFLDPTAWDEPVTCRRIVFTHPKQ
jgi:hypothetical protein